MDQASLLGNIRNDIQYVSALRVRLIFEEQHIQIFHLWCSSFWTGPYRFLSSNDWWHYKVCALHRISCWGVTLSKSGIWDKGRIWTSKNYSRWYQFPDGNSHKWVNLTRCTVAGYPLISSIRPNAGDWESHRPHQIPTSTGCTRYWYYFWNLFDRYS